MSITGPIKRSMYVHALPAQMRCTLWQSQTVTDNLKPGPNSDITHLPGL